MNINNIFTETFFKQNLNKFQNYDENSYLITFVDDNDDIINFITFKKEEFFKDTKTITNESKVSITSLTDLISSLEYGVDILMPINEGDDFYIIDLTLISKKLFYNLGFKNLESILYKPFSKIFPKLNELGAVNLFSRGYKNNEKLTLKLMLFSNKTLLYSVKYGLRRYEDYLFLISYESTNLDYTRKREHELFNESIIPLLIIQDGKAVRVNKAYLKLFELQEEDLINKPHIYDDKESLNMNIEERKKVLNLIMNHELLYHEDIRYFTNSKGEKVYVKSVIFPVTYNNRNAAQLSIINITDSINYEENLKKANSQLTDLVEEKNVLLKEVHHRVKNNLQIISSLLRLDSRFKEDNSESVLESTENRINSMALIHEKIYQSSDLAHVNIKEYVESEVNYLFTLYHVTNIRVVYDLENIELDMNQSIPLGLIINEMIINIIKYAFPNKIEGIVNINLKLKDDQIIFQLKDNGVGLPSDFDINNSNSLGLTVINGLVKQLEGEINLIQTKGTGYEIKFKKI